MISVKEYNQLIQDVAELEKKESQAEGALAEMNKSLKSEHGVADPKAATALRKKLEAELKTVEEELESAHQEYLTKYQELHKKA